MFPLSPFVRSYAPHNVLVIFVVAVVAVVATQYVPVC